MVWWWCCKCNATESGTVGCKRHSNAQAGQSGAQKGKESGGRLGSATPKQSTASHGRRLATKRNTATRQGEEAKKTEAAKRSSTQNATTSPPRHRSWRKRPDGQTNSRHKRATMILWYCKRNATDLGTVGCKRLHVAPSGSASAVMSCAFSDHRSPDLCVFTVRDVEPANSDPWGRTLPGVHT